MRTSRIVAISGARPGVGSTTIVVNLATLLAQKGDTLIVDVSDLLQSEVGFAVGETSVKTWSDITGMIGVDHTVIKSYLLSRTEALGILSCTTFEIYPALKWLAEVYAYIVIDNPVMSDESIFSLVNEMAVVTTPVPASIYLATEKIRELVAKGVCRNQINLLVNEFEVSPNSLNLEPHLKLPFAVAVGQYATSVSRLEPGATLIDSNSNGSEVSHLGGGKDGLDAIKERVLNKLADTKTVKDLLKDDLSDKTKKSFVEKVVRESVSNILGNKFKGLPDEKDAIIRDIINEAIGLGPIEDFVSDPDVTEIMVNGVGQIYLEKGGQIVLTDRSFDNAKRLMTVIERIVAPIGRRIDELSPIVDARLADGSRVHVIIPPLSLEGPILTIRKFSGSILTVGDMVERGALNNEMAALLQLCVKKKMNILISGGTNTGKTTMLNILSSFIPEDERIITIEDSAELNLKQPHVIRLEARPQNIEGKGEVRIRDLVRASLRMRPDRIVVGECRGGEALDMLQAMNTGHDGSLTTIHANSARDSLRRLETLVLFSGFDLPVRAIREQIASAVDLIIQLRRGRDGKRRIVNVSEVTGNEGDVVTLQELFSYDGEKFISSGFRPVLFEVRR